MLRVTSYETGQVTKIITASQECRMTSYVIILHEIIKNLQQNCFWFVFVLLVKFRIVRKCTEVIITKPYTNSSDKMTYKLMFK